MTESSRLAVGGDVRAGARISAPDPVSLSRAAMSSRASSKLEPQKRGSGRKAEQTSGRSGFPHRVHRFSGLRCEHLAPAGLFKVEMERAMQHAPHLRHSKGPLLSGKKLRLTY